MTVKPNGKTKGPLSFRSTNPKHSTTIAEIEKLILSFEVARLPHLNQIRKPQSILNEINSAKGQEFSVQETLTETEIESLLEIIYNHKVDYTYDFLKECGIRVSRSGKDDIHNKLRKAIKDKKLSGLHLIKLLNKIDSWGNQQVYLFKSRRTSL